MWPRTRWVFLEKEGETKTRRSRAHARNQVDTKKGQRGKCGEKQEEVRWFIEEKETIRQHQKENESFLYELV